MYSCRVCLSVLALVSFSSAPAVLHQMAKKEQQTYRVSEWKDTVSVRPTDTWQQSSIHLSVTPFNRALSLLSIFLVFRLPPLSFSAQTHTQTHHSVQTHLFQAPQQPCIHLLGVILRRQNLKMTLQRCSHCPLLMLLPWCFYRQCITFVCLDAFILDLLTTAFSLFLYKSPTGLLNMF